MFQSAPRDDLRGDPPFLPRITAPLARFQSAPRDDLRGDRPRPPVKCLIAKFQSAPRDDLRGDGNYVTLGNYVKLVSIRAPR